MKNLDSSPDPKVPYTLIAGQTSIIPSALGGEENSLFSRLWEKLRTKNWKYHLIDLAFFNSPNDMAVSVDSACKIPGGRSPEPKVVEPIACDHLTYFNSSAGLEALANSLG